MADNIEYKVDRLSEAIEDLYGKETLSKGDLTNLLNNLGARLEQLSSQNNSELGAIILSDVKKTLEEKNNLITGQINTLAGLLNTVKENLPPVTFNDEFGKIAKNINYFATQIASQEKLTGLIAQEIEQIKTLEMTSGDELNRSVNEIKNDLSEFSVNYESMVNMIKNNFIQLSQKASQSPELEKILVDIDKIQNNTNAVLSALSIIDHKYKDMSDIIEKLSNNNDAQILNDLANMAVTVATVHEFIKTLASKADQHELNNHLNIANESLEVIKQLIKETDFQNKTRLEEFTIVLESKISDISSGSDFENFKDQFEILIKSYSENTRSLNNEVSTLGATISGIEQKISQLSGGPSTSDKGVDDVQKSVNMVDSKIETMSQNIGTLYTGVKSIIENINASNHLLTEIKGFKDYLSQNNPQNDSKQSQILVLIKTELDRISNAVAAQDGSLFSEMSQIKETLVSFGSEISKIQLIVGGDFESKTKEIKDALESLTSSLNKYADLEANDSIEETIKPLIEKLNEEGTIRAKELSGALEALTSQVVMIQKEASLQAQERYTTLEEQGRNIKNELSSMGDLYNALKVDMSSALNEGLENIVEPLKTAVNIIEGIALNKDLKAMTITLEKTQVSLKDSLSTLRNNLNEMTKDSHLEILGKINNALPNVMDKLEITRSHLISENALHVENLKNSFADMSKTIEKSVVDANEINYEALNTSINEVLDMVMGLRDNYDSVNGDLTQTIKLDLQKVSDYMAESLENVNIRAQEEFEKHGVKIDELLQKVGNYESEILSSQKNLMEDYKVKFESLERIFEALNQDTYDKFSLAINQSNDQFKKDLGNQFGVTFEFIKGRISDLSSSLNRLFDQTNNQDNVKKLEGLILNSKSGIDVYLEDMKEQLAYKIDSTLTNEQFEEKHGEVIRKIFETKSALSELSAKTESLNQQQIHNDSQLLEEVTSISKNVNAKLNEFCEIDNIRNIIDNITSLESKLRNLIGNNSQFFTFSQEVKNHVDHGMREMSERLEATKGDLQRFDDENFSKTVKEIASLKSDILNLNSIGMDISSMSSQVSRLENSSKDIKDSLNIKIEELKEKFYELNNVHVDSMGTIKSFLEEKLGSSKGDNAEKIEAEIENVNVNIEKLQNNLFEDVQEIVEKKLNSFLSTLQETQEAIKDAILNDMEESAKGIHINIDNIRSHSLEEIIEKIEQIGAQNLKELKDLNDNNAPGDISRSLSEMASNINNIEDALRNFDSNLRASGDIKNLLNQKGEEIKSFITNFNPKLDDESINQLSGLIRDKNKEIKELVKGFNSQIDNESISQLADLIREKNKEVKELFKSFNPQIDHEPINQLAELICDKNNEVKDLIKNFKPAERIVSDNNSNIGVFDDKLEKTYEEISEASKKINELSSKLDNVNGLLKNDNGFNEAANELSGISKKLDSYEDKLGELKNYLSNIENQVKGLKKDEPGNYSYTLLDVESDLTKVRMNLEEFSKNIDMKLSNQDLTSFDIMNQNIMKMDLKVETLTDFVSNGSKVNKKANEVLLRLDKWADDTTEAIAYVSQNVSDTDILNEIKDKIERMSLNANVQKTSELENKVEDLISFLTKRFQQQEVQIQQLEARLAGSSDKKIIERMERMEQQLNGLENSIAKIVAYVE